MNPKDLGSMVSPCLINVKSLDDIYSLCKQIAFKISKFCLGPFNFHIKMSFC